MLPIEQSPNQTTTFDHHGAVLASLELSAKNWFLTWRMPDSQKLSKRLLKAGDIDGLLKHLRQLQASAEERLKRAIRVVTIQEAGLDGFWIHRVLMREGITSHVVDAASVAAPRRARNAKTDRIDGEALLRTLAAFLRGEPRVCSMVRPPSPEEEDHRRLSRERKVLLKERVSLTNRIRGLLRTQGIAGFDPLCRRRCKQLETLATADGRPLPTCLRATIARLLARLELILAQIKEVEHERDEMLLNCAPIARLTQLKGIGMQSAAILVLEGFYREFANRRQLAAYAGLAATPWRSGGIAREQGVSKAGNPRLRETMVELAWFWLKHQPQSQLSQWFLRRVGHQKGRVRRIAIVALARKLLVALWHYLSAGLVPEGAVVKTA